MKHDEAQRAELTETQRRWLAHLMAAERSEDSLRSYAEAHGLRVQALYDWKQVLKRKGVWPVGSSPVTLQRAQVVDVSPVVPVVARERPRSGGPDCRIRLPNGVVVELVGTGGTSLDEVLQAAGAWS